MASTLRHFHASRYCLYAYVVMDDHVHTVVQPFDAFPLQRIVHSWKSYSTNIFQRRFHRKSVIWQKDYYDRLILTEKAFLSTLKYIHHNPHKRWPEIVEYRWFGCAGYLPEDES